MAFRSKRRSTARTRRKVRHRPLSKHMVRAIQAISKGEIETKHIVYKDSFTTMLQLVAYTTPAQSMMIRYNIFSPIPRDRDDAVTREQHQVTGDVFDARGVKFWFDFYKIGTELTNLDVQFRFTVFKQDAYSGITGGIGSADIIVDSEFNTTPTQLHFNTQAVTILYQKRWQMRFGGEASSILKKVAWVPIKGKKTCVAETPSPGAGSSGIVGELKKGQYYFTLEVWCPGTTNLDTQLIGSTQWKIYWKDA